MYIYIQISVSPFVDRIREGDLMGDGANGRVICELVVFVFVFAGTYQHDVMQVGTE
jgi:hypothetical protein